MHQHKRVGGGGGSKCKREREENIGIYGPDHPSGMNRSPLRLSGMNTTNDHSLG